MMMTKTCLETKMTTGLPRAALSLSCQTPMGSRRKLMMIAKTGMLRKLKLGTILR